ncbi:MAG TPA: acyl-CoA dehydrogenase family protein [Candidatus Saccharimonadales bacterium]|nr:acyl-CoA dehydrogenase family protein [Candidatus Saccharimonadales bacterium]
MGLSFELSPEQAAIRQASREFASQVVAPQAADWDRREAFPYPLVAQMAELGLFGLPYPESVGGAGADFVSYLVALEEIARADAALAITMEAAVSLGIAPIFHYGSEEQKQHYLPDLCAGRQLWAFGLTEPEAGSDAGGTKTRARRDGEQWRIDGSKCFITNAGTDISAGVTITAITGNEGGRKQVSAFLVERGTPGFEVGPPYRKLGWHASDTRELNFAGCQVPAANVLGKEGGGLGQFFKTLEAGRVAIAALSVGVAQACLDASLSYSQQRRQFGRAISQFQATQLKLADMATQIELSRLMVWRAGNLIDLGQSPAQFAAMAKVQASETATWCANQAVQIHGGAGFMEDLPVARYYRDVKINEIGEGTSEIQRLMIASHLLGLGGSVSRLIEEDRS